MFYKIQKDRKKKTKKKIKFYSSLCLLALIFFLTQSLKPVQAADNLDINYSPQAFTAPVSLKIASSSFPVNLPWQWQALSPVYDYSFKTDGFYDPSRPLQIRIDYLNNNNYLKKILIFDSWAKVWRALPTTDFPKSGYASATLTSTSGRLLLAANSNFMTVGDASWYKYKNGLFAASPDFPKGSVLQVVNLDNNKSVEVTINDYGPERALFPKRVIDLDYQAFKKIASPSLGLIKVKLIPKKLIGPAIKKNIVANNAGPEIAAHAAVIMREKDGQILWGKNQNEVRSLASLTKLVALRVFFDTRPSLDRIVSYREQDENYNYKYVAPWESARVRLQDGEKIRVKDLVYSALVGSANNAVESLVRVSGLSRPEFISKMNQLVHNWGANDTYFIEPSGLSPKNVSSPEDYAIITKEIFTNPLIEKITTTLKYSFKTLNTGQWHTIRNTDRLLALNSYKFIGSKTGYLDEAQYCLMTRVKTSQGNLIAINFGSPTKTSNFADNEKLIRYGIQLLKK